MNIWKKEKKFFKKELRKKKISFSDFLTDENIDKIISELKLGSLEEAYINIGNNKLSPIAIINIVTDSNDKKEDIILKKSLEKRMSI